MISKNQLVLAFLFFSASVFANNLLVESVSLVDQNIVSGYTYVKFDVSWENSWRNLSIDPFNYDAIWVFIKYKVEGDTLWNHASLSTTSSDHSVIGTNGVSAEFKVGQTNSVGKGVFIQRSADGTGNIDWDQVKIQWLYEDDGVADDANVTVKVFAIEMVYIPEGAFYVGDGSTTDVGGHLHSADMTTEPFLISSEAFILLGQNTSNRLGNNDGQGQWQVNFQPNYFTDDFNSSTGEYLDDSFPKGFDAFYIMKYEITQGQYKDFLNCLTREQQNNRTETNLDYNTVFVTNRYVMTEGGGSIEMQSRNSIKCDAVINPTGSITFYCNYNGTPGDGEHIAANYIHWLDGTAYADWAGLRPFTELEFEKVCRGANQNPVTGEYGWGNTNIHSSNYDLVDDGAPDELPTNPSMGINGNSAYNADSTGDITLPVNFGPLRTGIFATSSSDRIISGSSYYGVMDLTGNLWEAIISIGIDPGRDFRGSHGDGVIYSKGEHNIPDWPGYISAPGGSGLRRIWGSGFRGGGINWKEKYIRISDRTFSNVTVAFRATEDGFRLARTAP